MASYDMETPPTASSARAGNTIRKSTLLIWLKIAEVTAAG